MEDDLKKIYRRIRQWCKYLRKSKNDDYEKYIKQIKKQLPKSTKIDNAICCCLKHILNEQHKFYIYRGLEQAEGDLDIKALERLLSLLLAKEVISDKQAEDVKGHIHYNLQKKVEILLQRSAECRSLSDFNELWAKVICLQMNQFWAFIKNEVVEDDKLITLYRLCRMNSNFHSVNAFYLQYIRLVKKYKPCQLLPIQSYENKGDVLESIVGQNCLFMNPKMIEDATRQIMRLQLFLKQMLYPNNFNFKLFGSLRNRTTLIHDMDGDVTILSNKFDLSTLQHIYEVFSNNLKTPNAVTLDELRRVQLKRHRKPYLKIIYYDLKQNECTFHGSNFHFDSIDLLVNNSYGVKNSTILARYTRNKQIMKFCCLTKLWAKSKSLINSISPVGHFSSYGMNIMTIYYLIRTQQAPYLQKIQNNQYQMLGEINITKDMFALLIGFFEFYKRHSEFHVKKEVACLLQGNHRHKYDSDIIVNMYDFVDGTNPGRMKVEKEYMFYNHIDYAIRVLSGKSNKFATLFMSDR